MKTLFDNLLNMSISASIVIIGILILRWICRKQPKKWTILLWLIAGFRLLCPISFSSQMSVFQYTTAVDHQVRHVPAVSNLISSDFQIGPAGSTVNTANDILRLIESNFYIVWLLVCSILILRMVYKYVQLHHALRPSIELDHDVFLNDTIQGPFVFGLLHPRIYLPSNLNEPKRNLIILHEQAHIIRKDHIWKAFSYLLVCIYWFNPMIWIGYYFLTLDMEMACDEHATASLSNVEKANYSEVLLSMAYKRYDYMPNMPFSKQGVSLRIKNLLQTHKQPVWIIVIVCIVLVISSIALLSNPMNLTSETDQIEDLYAKRTAYVGDAVKVRKIIDELPLPDGLQVDHIELKTDNNPYGYGLSIQYTGAYNDKKTMEKTLIRNASLLLALVENLSYVEYHSDTFTRLYTIDEMYDYYPVLFNQAFDSFEDFSDLYLSTMMNEDIFDKVMEYPEEISEEYAQSSGFYIETSAGIQNAAAGQKFWEDSKNGLRADMTILKYTTDGIPVLYHLHHDEQGYSCVIDAARDASETTPYHNYHYRHMVEILTENGSDVYLTTEQDLNAERIQRAIDNDVFINYLYVYHKENTE